MNCKCHPDSPFLWRNNPRPSIFVRDQTFRAAGVIVTEHGSFLTKEAEQKKSKEMKEKEMLAYKQFGIYMRANPQAKPNKNKHEI